MLQIGCTYVHRTFVSCIMFMIVYDYFIQTQYKVCTHYFYIVTDYVKKDGHIMILC